MGNLVLTGATSGSTTIQPTDAVTATLTLPSSTGTLLSTANPQSGGVIQVIQGTYATAVTSNNNTPIATGLTATITPKFSTSKILICFNHPLNKKSSDNSANDIGFWLYKNGVNLLQVSPDLAFTGTAIQLYMGFSYSYIDSPATTSATTYATYFSSNNSNAVSATVGVSNVTNTIILMEIAA